MTSVKTFTCEICFKRVVHHLGDSLMLINFNLKWVVLFHGNKYS